MKKIDEKSRKGGKEQMKQIKIKESGCKERKMKRLSEQGVTLVALVVTIVIMLILAGIAIRLSLGDNGLINQAKRATDKYKNAQSNEEHYLDTVTNTIEDVREAMHRITAEELSENPKKYYGKYVNYGVDLNGDNDYTNDWKLFYVGGSDKDDSDDVKGRIYIIAADYVPMNHSALKGVVAETAEGESNTGLRRATESGYETLSAFWGDSAPAYQSLDKLNPDPINLFMHTGYNISSNSSNANSVITSTLLNTNNWSRFAGGKYGYAAIGGPTIEMWCKAWNVVVDEVDGFRKIYSNGNGANGYYVGASAEQTDTAKYYISSSSSAFNIDEKETIEAKYNIFFPHTENTKVTANDVTGNCDGYWLASPSVNSVSGVLYVDFYGQVVYGAAGTKSGGGLRPLVCLEKGVRLQKNTSKSDETKTVYDIVK